NTSLNAAAVRLSGTGITQTGGSNVTATTLRLDSTAAVTLANSGNTVGTLAAAVSGTLSVGNSGGLIIGTASSLLGIDVGGKSLNLTANGAITQTAGITAGAATFSSTFPTAAITLDSAANAISGTIVFAPTGVANVTLVNTGATHLGTSAIGGNLSVTSTGA